MKFRKILTIGIGEASLDQEYWRKLDSLAEKRVSLPKDSPEIKRQLADADCLLVSFLVGVGRDYIDNAHNLKYIGVLATAYDKIDTAYVKSKGITVCNIPGYSTESVAEFVFATILEHIREIERAKKQAREGIYSEDGFSVTEIRNKIFGVFGLGRIGSRVAEIALGFGADVRYWSRNRKIELEQKGIKYEDADSLISKSDFLSIHLSKTNDTISFFDRNRINRIKKGAIVINTCPMALLDVNALQNRLKNGDITFILDHSDEMGDELKSLSKYKNCIVYPPVAYISKEARTAKQDIFIRNMESFLKGKTTSVVN